MRFYVVFVVFAASVASPVIAADEAPEQDELHDGSEDIVVTAAYRRSKTDLLSSVSVLSGEELAVEARGQLGDTISRQPGVSSTSFGPGASRPVLRGFSGERIRVLTDGIGSIDLSNLSSDHAVAIDVLTAERVEVVRGPSTLMYGSSAIGGLVNVLDKRIPRRVPDHLVHVDAISSYSTAANEFSAGASADARLGENFSVHADGSYRNSDDLETGGAILAPVWLADADAAGNGEEARETKLRNTAVETTTAGLGTAFIADGGELGVSFGYYDTKYGIPVRIALEPDQEEEAARISLRQYRLDARGSVDLPGFFEKLSVRAGAVDYRHFEIVEGEIETTFKNKGLEGRVELAQAERGGWRGAVGGQFHAIRLDIDGAEALLPRNDQSGIGLFAVQELELGNVRLEASARFERSDVRASSINFDKSFDAGSGALGGSVGLGGDFRTGVNLSRTTRAPSANELLVNGPHVATQAFEKGDSNLGLEKQTGVEAFLRADGKRGEVNLAVYYSDFKGFIYDAATGEIEDGLPVFQIYQGKATYWGAEAEVRRDFLVSGSWTFGADLVADYTHAKIDDVGPAPRIPPLRLLGGLEARSERLEGRIEVEWADDQTRVSGLETPTDGYTVVNAAVTWRPFASEDVALILSAENIGDAVVRRHASYLKDFAPLAGRDVRLTFRSSF